MAPTGAATPAKTAGTRNPSPPISALGSLPAGAPGGGGAPSRAAARSPGRHSPPDPLPAGGPARAGAPPSAPDSAAAELRAGGGGARRLGALRTARGRRPAGA